MTSEIDNTFLVLISVRSDQKSAKIVLKPLQAHYDQH